LRVCTHRHFPNNETILNAEKLQLILRAVNGGKGNFVAPSPLRLRSRDRAEAAVGTPQPASPPRALAGSPPRARLTGTPELPTAAEDEEEDAAEAVPLSARATGRARTQPDRLGASGAVPKPKAAKAKGVAKPKGARRATGPRGSYITKALKMHGLSSGSSTESPMVISGRHLGARATLNSLRIRPLPLACILMCILNTIYICNFAGTPPPKLKDLQKQLNEANQKVAALESKQTTNDEITAYKVKTAVAEAEAKFHTVSAAAFQSGCEFAMKIAAQTRAPH